MERAMKVISANRTDLNCDADDIDAVVRMVNLSQKQEKVRRDYEKRCHDQMMRRLANHICWFISGACVGVFLASIISFFV